MESLIRNAFICHYKNSTAIDYFCSIMSIIKLTVLIADYWKMDGGVAFGVVPKSLWTKVYPEDTDNLINICTRCLLIETENRKILVDTGMGNKRGDKYYAYKYRTGTGGIAEQLHKISINPEEITDVVFTHLHDDHVGGATELDKDGNLKLIFENASYWCSESHWKWSEYSNKREAAAYFTDNLNPIKESGRLNLIKESGNWLDGIEFRIFNGHTRGQLIPLIRKADQTYVFAGDFIPSKAHIPLPYVPAVDIEPLLTLTEKESFLEEALENQYIMIFEHDFYNEACQLISTEKGVAAGETFTIESVN